MNIRPLYRDEIASLVRLRGEHAAHERTDYEPEAKSEHLRSAIGYYTSLEIREVAKEGVDMTPAQPVLEVSAPWTYREKLFNLGPNGLEPSTSSVSRLA
jgi:hypothetical protein